MGFWALGMRGMIITNEGEDYMILAEAKGLSKYKIFWKYLGFNYYHFNRYGNHMESYVEHPQGQCNLTVP